MKNDSQILWLSDLEIDSHNHIKSEIKKLSALTQAKFPVIPGFVITDKAYFSFLKENNLDHKVSQLLQTIAIERPDSLMQGEHHIWQLFKKATHSENFIQELRDFYLQLGEGNVSAILFETHDSEKKHITKHAEAFDTLIDQIITLWAEMFTSQALWHRHQIKQDHIKTPATILIQKRITGESKGTIVTIEPNSHEKDKMVIITHHPHENDIYILSKKNVSIIDRKLKHSTKQPKLTLDEILAITKMAKRIENFLYFPQEISWVIEENKLYITSVTPFSELPKKYPEPKRKLSAARGKGITQMIGTGYVTVIQSSSDLKRIKEHTVIIAHELPAKYFKKLKKVRGVILESGFPQSELAALLRKQAIPAIFQVKHATKLLKNGHLITLHGRKGEIYRGGFL